MVCDVSAYVIYLMLCCKCEPTGESWHMHWAIQKRALYSCHGLVGFIGLHVGENEEMIEDRSGKQENRRNQNRGTVLNFVVYKQYNSAEVA